MRFASLNSPNASVRARLQAALFTNRKRNRARRSADQEGNDWGAGSLTVGDDVDNSSVGYNGYESIGSIVSPNPAYPIIYLGMEYGGAVIYMDIEGDVSAILAGATITIKGQTFSLGSFSLNGGVSTTSISAVADLISLDDVGNTIPFTINLA